MMNEREPNRPERVRPDEEPRIYVASLSDYNAGILHGRWIDATVDADTMQEEIDAMLAESPTTARYGDIAEEWAIHDYENFGELQLDESEALSTVAQLAEGIRAHGAVFAAFASLVGTREIDGLERFEDRYQGEWDSIEAYAEDLLDQLGAHRMIDETPEWLQSYLALDAGAFGRDLELNGDVSTIETPNGGVWVFGP
jgi:antirestriction protein